jgi:GNAT superfamily N-acetyltransferase
MLIRDAIDADVTPLAQMHIASWKPAYRGIVPDQVLDNISLEKRSNMWRDQIANPDRIVICYEEAGTILGGLIIGAARDEDLDASKTAELMVMYVHPDHWRRGIGSALWERAQPRLDRRFAEMILWVFRDNPPARRFYERIGFAFDGTEKPDDLGDLPLIEVRYRKRLDLHPDREDWLAKNR